MEITKMCLKHRGKPHRTVRLTYKMEEEEFARRTGRWNEHLQVVDSRCRDPEAEERMPVFPPREKCPGVSVSCYGSEANPSVRLRRTLSW